MTTKSKDTYLGPDKISTAEELDKKSPSGDTLVRLTFEDGGYCVLGMKVSGELITSEPTDANVLADKRMRLLSPVFIAAAADLGICYGELDYYTTGIRNNIVDAFEKAEHKLWTGKTDGFVSGYSGKQSRTLAEADIILSPDENE